MKYRFEFRRYRLPFRAVVRTGHGAWSEREGVIVRLQTGADASSGFGEAAPVPGFAMESVDEIATACAGLGEVVDEERLRSVPERLPTLRNAIENALNALPGGTAAEGSSSESVSQSPVPHPQSPAPLGVAALLPAGRAALEIIPPRADAGFRVFKWKVGVGDVADELALLDDVCAALPSGAKLRLDANGAWDRRKAERWLERCAERPVEFVEQPIAAEAGPFARAGRTKEMDLLLGLAGDFPTPLALDESLVGDGDVERWLGAGWPGVFVVKPALFGDLPGALEKLARAQADVVFSSALETAVGARAALRTAFAWAERVRAKSGSAGMPESRNSGSPALRGSERPALRPSDTPASAPKPRALGFGVWPLFADARCDGPAVAPFIRWEDVARIDAARVWTALGADGGPQTLGGGR